MVLVIRPHWAIGREAWAAAPTLRMAIIPMTSPTTAAGTAGKIIKLPRKLRTGIYEYTAQGITARVNEDSPRDIEAIAGP